MNISILYIVSILPPYIGGAAVDYNLIIDSLLKYHKDGINRIEVITESGCKIPKDNKLIIKDILHRYDSSTKKNKILQFINYLILIKNILSSKYDIIHIHARYVYSKYFGKIIWWALYFNNTTIVIDIRDKFYNNYGSKHNYLVCSDGLYDYYKWIDNKELIHYPIIKNNYKSTIKAKYKIGYFGNISLDKGVIELIQGYLQYRMISNKPMELHLWGCINLDSKHTQYIYKRNVIYNGIISNEDVYNEIQKCHCIILPSVNEGLPRICIEAISMNKLIYVHKNIREITEYIPSANVLPDLEISTISNCLLNAEKQDTFVKYNYDINKHNLKTVSLKMYNYYKNIINIT